jgi:hypothetical protein
MAGYTGAFNSVGVANYSTPADGAAADAAAIQQRFYPDILAALKAGKGLDTSSYASELSTWSGGGYTSISGVFSEAAQYLSGGGTVSASAPTGTGSDISLDSSGILGIPTDITSFFTDANKFVNALMWIVEPGSWLRIAAFGVAIILLLAALVVFTKADQKITSAPIPVPVPV